MSPNGNTLCCAVYVWPNPSRTRRSQRGELSICFRSVSRMPFFGKATISHIFISILDPRGVRVAGKATENASICDREEAHQSERPSDNVRQCRPSVDEGRLPVRVPGERNYGYRRHWSKLVGSESMFCKNSFYHILSFQLYILRECVNHVDLRYIF